MSQKLTKKTVQLFFVLGIFIAPLSMQALFAVETPQNRTFGTEISKNKTHFPASVLSEDVVIDDLVMADAQSRSLNSSNCSWGAPVVNGSSDVMDVTLENGSSWTASFKKGNNEVVVKLNYDAQTDIMGFGKTLDRGMTYTIAQDNSSISFFFNGKPFIAIDQIRNCHLNVCLKIRFLMNKVMMSEYSCATSASASRVTTQNQTNNALAQQKTAVTYKGDESVNLANFKKLNIVSGHQAVPNPVNNQTYIQYYLTEDALVRVSIYNAIGQQIKVLVNQNQSKGAQSIEWNMGEELKGGMYFYEITVKNVRMIGKVIKL